MSNASMSARDARHVFGPDGEPTEMEVRVADALKSVDDSKPKGGLGASYLSLARAAIRAMRDPTPEMLGAEFVYKNCQMCGGASEQYPRMVKAASPGDV